MNQIKTLLNAVRPGFESLRCLTNGPFHQVYSYQIQGKWEVIRFGKDARSFQRESFIQSWLANRQIPLSRIQRMGKYHQHFFSIGTFCPKENLQNQPIMPFLPNLMPILFELHTTTLPPLRPRYLVYRSAHPITSWKQYLSQYWGQAAINVKQAIQQDYLTSAEIQTWNTWIQSSLADAKEALYWLHGDLKPNNLCGQKGEITGLIDWSEMMLGDYLYDLAKLLLFWPKETWLLAGRQIFQYYQQNGLSSPQDPLRLLGCFGYWGIRLLAKHRLSQETSFANELTEKLALLAQNPHCFWDEG